MAQNLTNKEPNITSDLERICFDLGTNLTDVCTRADVNRGKVSTWKDKEPYTFRDVRKLVDEVRSIAKEKGIEIPEKLLI